MLLETLDLEGKLPPHGGALHESKRGLPFVAQQMTRESHVFSFFSLVFSRAAAEDWQIGMMAFLVAFCRFCQWLVAPEEVNSELCDY